MAAAAGGDGYWMHELSYSSLESSDSGYTQQPWLPDELCTDCMLCQQPFGLFRWTHHCRDCGGLYCSECSSHRVESGLKEGSATLRVCDRCAFTNYPEHLGCERPFECPRCSMPKTSSQVNVYLLLGLRSLACASCIPCTALMHAARPTHSEPPIRFGSFSGGAFTPPEFTPPHSASPTNSNGHAGSGGSSGNGNGGGGLSGYGFSGMCAGSFARTVDVSGSRVQAPAAGEGGARWGSVPRLKIRNDGS